MQENGTCSFDYKSRTLHHENEKRNIMEIHDLKPRTGNGTYRIDDSDDLVVIENNGGLPFEQLRLEDHGIIIICTEGWCQFEYDGLMKRVEKNNLFLYMAHSVVTFVEFSPDFNSRQIWFSRDELWNINLYSKTGLSDMQHLKLHPIVHLSEDDVTLLDHYFQLLCRRMGDSAPVLHCDIVRSLFASILLEILSMLRRSVDAEADALEGQSTSFHKRRMVNRFMHMLEESDGRIRRVEEFASRLNITPKYLSFVVKEIMHRRPSTYIHLFTMKAIEHRLRFTDMTMQEIANDLNFPNPSFFGKYFKEHTGITPLEYRMKFHRGGGKL